MRAKDLEVGAAYRVRGYRGRPRDGAFIVRRVDTAARLVFGEWCTADWETDDDGDHVPGGTVELYGYDTSEPLTAILDLFAPTEEAAHDLLIAVFREQQAAEQAADLERRDTERTAEVLAHSLDAHGLTFYAAAGHPGTVLVNLSVEEASRLAGILALALPTSVTP